MFIQRRVITVKKDKSVKIALDSSELNKAIVNDKYQTPIMELIDPIPEQPDTTEREPWFYVT